MADQPVSETRPGEGDVQVVHTVNPAGSPDIATDPNPVAPPPTPAVEKTAEVSGLPVANNTFTKEAAKLGLQVAAADQDGTYLFITIHGPDVDTVQGPDSRKLAYAARFNYGFDNAGIELHSGSLPIGEGRYQQVFRLTRSMA